ncbi:MAG: hypothetical protein QXF52_11465 [Thermoproteota archaeon]
MTEPVPIYAQQAYAILYNRFRDQPFNSDYLTWFLTKSMVKKILHVLERKSWIKRVKKGTYVCMKPDVVFEEMVRFRVPNLLEEAGKKYCYADASAVEVWTDYTYMQRNWEHSPYFIKVLRKDTGFWIQYFRKHEINVFVEKASPAIGEFVILFPRGKLDFEVYNGKPVDRLKKVVEFCERDIDVFEYPLAYLRSKFRVKTKVKIDERVLRETARVV